LKSLGRLFGESFSVSLSTDGKRRSLRTRKLLSALLMFEIPIILAIAMSREFAKPELGFVKETGIIFALTVVTSSRRRRTNHEA